MATPLPAPTQRHPLRLPAGSIRGAMSLLIAGLFWTLLLLSEQKNIPIPLFLYFLSGMVLLFFVSHGNSIAAPGQTPPLGMPRGSLRAIILGGTLIVIAIYSYQHNRSPLQLLVPQPEQLAQWPQLLAALLIGLVSGWLIGRGPWRNAAFFQDIQAWISVLAMIGLVIEVIVLLFINPSLEKSSPLDLHVLEAILTGIIAWYFGSRS